MKKEKMYIKGQFERFITFTGILVIMITLIIVTL